MALLVALGRRRGGPVLARRRRGAAGDGLVGVDAAGAQGRLHAVGEHLHDLDVGVALVLGGDDLPEPVAGVRRQPAVEDGQVLVVVLDLPDVGVVDLPGARRVAHEVHDAPALHLARDVEEEPHDEKAVVLELAFEHPHRLDMLFNALLGAARHVDARLGVELGVALQADVLDVGARKLVVVGLVEYRHRAALAQAAPIARHEREARLVADRLLHRMHRVGARVEVDHEVGDAAPLAGRPPSLEHDDCAHVRLDGMLLEHHEALLDRLAARTVLAFSHLGGKLESREAWKPPCEQRRWGAPNTASRPGAGVVGAAESRDPRDGPGLPEERAHRAGRRARRARGRAQHAGPARHAGRRARPICFRTITIARGGVFDARRRRRRFGRAPHRKPGPSGANAPSAAGPSSASTAPSAATALATATMPYLKKYALRTMWGGSFRAILGNPAGNTNPIFYLRKCGFVFWLQTRYPPEKSFATRDSSENRRFVMQGCLAARAPRRTRRAGAPPDPPRLRGAVGRGAGPGESDGRSAYFLSFSACRRSRYSIASLSASMSFCVFLVRAQHHDDEHEQNRPDQHVGGDDIGRRGDDDRIDLFENRIHGGVPSDWMPCGGLDASLTNRVSGGCAGHLPGGRLRARRTPARGTSARRPRAAAPPTRRAPRSGASALRPGRTARIPAGGGGRCRSPPGTCRTARTRTG